MRKNEALATSGPYAYTRNPLYLGSLLIGVGFAVAARSWWVGVALVVMFFAIYLPVIQGEEKFLRERFPEFEEYARGVPRMLPRLIPASASEGGGKFSMNLYLKHREWNALLGAIALMAILIAKIVCSPVNTGRRQKCLSKAEFALSPKECRTRWGPHSIPPIVSSLRMHEVLFLGWSYSIRRARMGSMLAARFAGINPANAAKADNTKTAPASVKGS